ncbi:uncharacterized protein N7483_000770 [Penicillium malachiteum]|uniref:uncharacterized protein n=1 Tax=Penicillium malachiteum TaxID=1324776 RepID=UPI0025468DB1|nr:uncharacterized protein N7483_000770 [Penicillium malachiteum]KAJ5735645.1 hypothetical protein N7483_000770 [Penicillium malachiteum]
MTDEATRNLAVKTVAAVFMPVAVISVMLRCYVRGFVVRAFGLDDAAMFFYVMFCGCMIGGTLYGTGYKFVNLEPDNRASAMKYWWLCETAYCFASIGCKISVCIFLMRITVKRSHIWTLYTVMILTVIAGLVFFFLMLLQCKPLVFAAMCDFTVGILPIFLVSKLQMKRKAKMAVVGILSMACIASSAVIVRFPFVETFANDDFLWATYQIAIWSCIEAGLGITAGSLATLRPLLHHWLGSRPDKYNSSGFPRRSNSRRVASGQRGLPLGSLDVSHRSELRPDKLAVMVTNIESQGIASTWRRSSSVSSSEQALTNERSSQIPGGKIQVGVHQTFEVTQTTSDEIGEGSHRSAREHV